MENGADVASNIFNPCEICSGSRQANIRIHLLAEGSRNNVFMAQCANCGNIKPFSVEIPYGDTEVIEKADLAWNSHTNGKLGIETGQKILEFLCQIHEQDSQPESPDVDHLIDIIKGDA